ncbi:putative f-box protein [Botrytis fragariae]|uniref:Glycerophosphocholine acyltransferase 1 n=1 Tax=Botrytis fragariae TaxID=1964551 RepID=A0A8H6AU74_9HELO|nr:putative f-box protein [Botrytis fragariae]KAF5873672.1 putative f-box protein [Botrytis fragariae]
MADIALRGASAFRRICFYDPIHARPRSIAEMTEPIPIPASKSEPALESTSLSSEQHLAGGDSSTGSSPPEDGITPTYTTSENGSPRLSRRPSASGSSTYQEDWEPWPPLDKITVFDLLENFDLPQQLERIQRNLSAQSQKVRKQRDKLKTRSSYAKTRVVEEWRKRVPTADEQLDRYKKRMRDSVDKLGTRWNDTKSVTIREKVSFICGVLNVLISGYLIGGYPELFHWWYTAQLLYFMPIRFYAYHKRGYHYFLADLCYFTNFLCFLSIWIFPHSKRLFISTYCLAMGNNAVAIAMWRNSMVFHSFDKVTSLFIHIMPCVTLHCLVHLIDPSVQQSRFSAIYDIRTSPVGSSNHYGLLSMALWSSIPYAIWQLSYHFLITVRRREKIAAGRPTSFTWLLKSYSKVWIGKAVLALPESMQEPAFMLIQYSYALLTMLPCPLWFWYRYASASFLMAVFCWSVYNGANYYIEVFGKRFQNELEEMKREVQKWHNTPELMTSPLMTPRSEGGEILSNDGETKRPGHLRSTSLDKIPLLNDQGGSSGIDGGAKDVVKTRKADDTSA